MAPPAIHDKGGPVPITALLVPPGTDDPIVRVQLRDEHSSLRELQRLVGGSIDRLVIRGRSRDDVTFWINDEGKNVCVDEDGNVLVNDRVTSWMRHGNARLSIEAGCLFAGDYVAGPVVITGHDGQGGSCDAPQEFLSLATGASHESAAESR